MALDDTYALWIENAGAVNHARGYRRLIDDLMGRYGEGILMPDTGLKVTQRGAGANMSVDVAAGSALVTGDDSSSQGVYYGYNDATYNIAISASDPTNPRKDIIGVQVRDQEYAGSSNDARLVVVTGTPAASPVDPTLPNNFLSLARVNVAALATSITNANITDLRTRVGAAMGVLGYAQVTADQTGIGSTATDLTGLTVTVTVPAGRRLRISAQTEFDTSTAGNYAHLTAVEGSTAIQLSRINVSSPGQEEVVPLSVVRTPAAGTITYKLQGARNSGGTGTVGLRAGSTKPSYILVEDIGPSPVA